MAYGVSDHRILSEPVGVHWDGWRSDTLTLQRHGWNLAVDYEPRFDRYRLAMRHSSLRLYALTSALTIRRVMDGMNHYGATMNMPVFNVAHIAPQIQVIHMHDDLTRFKAFDATPVMIERKIRHIEDFNIFNVTGKQEQVLVERADLSVIEHLEAIKQLQSPKQRELRQRAEVQTERIYQKPQLRLVASLVSYEEAA